MNDTAKMFDAIGRFKEIDALVIGDIMLDVYEYCLTNESKPLRSEKVSKRAYKSQRSIKALGGAGNVAANLASLGVSTSLAGLTGNDEQYFKLRELCEAGGIQHFLIRDSARPTTTKIRLYIDDEYHLRRDDESIVKIDNETAATLVREIVHLIPKMDVVLLSDYNKGIFNEYISQEIIKECRIHSIPVIVDFKPANTGLFCGSDIMCPNEHEAKELYPQFDVNRLEHSVHELYCILRSGSVVVTLGRNGLAGYDGKTFFHIKGHDVPELDAVGCGDTVRAGLALGCTLGLSLKDSAALANYAAAVIVQKPNTSSLSCDELKAFISKSANSKEP